MRRILEPMLAGTSLGEVPEDDLRFVHDLGSGAHGGNGRTEIANPIYREIVPRTLSYTAVASLPRLPATWLRADGRLDTGRLMEAFLAFWRQHGQPLLGTAPYHEIAPHLVLMAFLHRVANGGGTLEREYAIGTGRMDVCLRYGPDTLALERQGVARRKQGPARRRTGTARWIPGGPGARERLAGDIFDRRSEQPPIAESGPTPPWRR